MQLADAALFFSGSRALRPAPLLMLCSAPSTTILLLGACHASWQTGHRSAQPTLCASPTAAAAAAWQSQNKHEALLKNLIILNVRHSQSSYTKQDRYAINDTLRAGVTIKGMLLQMFNQSRAMPVGVTGATVCRRSRRTVPVSREAATLVPLLRATFFMPLMTGPGSPVSTPMHLT